MHLVSIHVCEALEEKSETTYVKVVTGDYQQLSKAVIMPRACNETIF